MRCVEKWIIALVVLMLLLALLAWRRSARQAYAGQVPLRIAHCTWVGYGPFYIAQEKGFFKRHGVDVELVRMENENLYAPALLKGHIDALGNTLDREVIHAAHGVPIRMVLGLCESVGADAIVSGPDVETVADLRGKTIALDKSSTSCFFLFSVLHEHGISETEVNLVDLPASSALGALQNHLVDACVTWEPWLTLALRVENTSILASSRDFPGVVVDVLSVREGLLETAPETVQGVVNAWMDAVDYLRDHPDESYRLMADYFHKPEADIREMASRIRFMGRCYNIAYFDQASEVNIYQQINHATQFWQGRQSIPRQVEAAALADERFILRTKERPDNHD